MNESYWQKTNQHPCFKQLNKDIKTDILIIGGGLSGISCAYQLKETGKQITIDIQRLKLLFYKILFIKNL